ASYGNKLKIPGTVPQHASADATGCFACHGSDYSGNTTNNVHNPGAGSGPCTLCHASTQNTRRPIKPEFGYVSHHSQNVDNTTVGTGTCVQCHMEGNVADNTINNTYHKNGVVDLVVYTTYPARGTSVSLTNLSDNLLKANAHCLSCHNATNAAATPFSTDNNDLRTPRNYAWDNVNIDKKYTNVGSTVGTNVTPFGKVSSSTNNAVPADLINKAFSPHGNLANNHGGFATTGLWTDRFGASSGTTARTGATNVACLDCHNSHGSQVSGSTSYISPATSYTAATTAPGNGGLLKNTSTYTPTASTTAGNLYSAQAALCFDCHLGDNAGAPKKYSNFGTASQAVQSYYDAGRWGSTATWSGSFAYKSKTLLGGHFGASTTSASGAAISMKTTPADKILGLCTKCHDPHGVDTSKTYYDYMIPALKGTWMTSPYKEDRAGSQVGGTYKDPNTNSPSNANVVYSGPRQTPAFLYNQPPRVGGGYGTGISSSTYGKGGTGYDGYFIDENTFGNSQINNLNFYPWSGTTITSNYMTQTDNQFAGLCMNCHPKTGGTAAIGTVSSNNGPYTFIWGNKGSYRSVSEPGNAITVHRTVKGWDGVATAQDIFKYYLTLQHIMTENGGGGQRVRAISSYTAAPSGYRWSVNPGTTMHTPGWAPQTDTNFGPGKAVYGGQQNDGFVQATFHRYSCAKCHTPHVSRLPRLMKTNCLDVGTDNTALTAKNKHGSVDSNYAGTGFQFGNAIADRNSGGAGGYAPNERPMHCHNQRKENKPAKGGWNIITGWP
ncbi:MAG: hypothetical protein HZA60_03940, partial [Deltaproteobacteria bacterium]|nr:hypothetical protein [Deltaproteobacteria bacterium]